MKTIKVKELEVPADIITDVADIIAANDLDNCITGIDKDHTVVFIEVSYDKDDDREKQAMHDIEDAIADYDPDDDEQKEGA